MSNDEKDPPGEHSKKVLERRNSEDPINKESRGRNVGNTITPADINAIKENQEEKKNEVIKKGEENKGKPWSERFKKQDTQEPQTRHQPTAAQREAQDQQRRNATEQSGGRTGRGGAPSLPQPEDMLKEKNDVVKPDDLLSKKQQNITEKVGVLSLSARERTNRAKEAKAQQAPKVDKAVEVAKDVKQLGIRERIAKATAEKDNAQARIPAAREKNVELAINKAKATSPKSIKR